MQPLVNVSIHLEERMILYGTKGQVTTEDHQATFIRHFVYFINGFTIIYNDRPTDDHRGL